METGRFTDDEVREIRWSRRAALVLAEEYGVSHTTIQNVRKHRTYARVPDYPYPEAVSLDVLWGPTVASPKGRFTDDEVREIRRLDGPAGVLAEEYGVSDLTIENIRGRRTYAHVPDYLGQETDTPDDGREREPSSRKGRFTDDEVREIRRLDGPARVLADKYRVSHTTIQNIRNYRSYPHIREDSHLEAEPYKYWGEREPAFKNRYVRKSAMELMSGLPSGYCPTVVTSPPPSFSMVNYIGSGSYVDRELEFIEENIRVAGDQGIVLYHSAFNIKDVLYDAGLPLHKVITWYRDVPSPSASDPPYGAESFIFMFTGRHWTNPPESSLEDVWRIKPVDEWQYRGIVGYIPTDHHQYLQQWWHYFPDELADKCIALGKGTVLDPFAGTGAIPLAAMRAGRDWLAGDLRSPMIKAFERRYSLAIEDNNRGLALNPKYAEAYANRGDAKRQTGDHLKAIADYNLAIALNPDYGPAYYNRGNAKRDQGDFAKGLLPIADFDRAIDLDPGSGMAYHSRALAKRDQGDFAEAIADFDRAIDLDPGSGMAYHSRALAKRDQGDFAEAIADFDRAIDLDPGSGMAYHSRALAKRDSGDLDGARADIARAMTLTPQ